jgi:putative nucleotidyltransferase with HDIG domain
MLDACFAEHPADPARGGEAGVTPPPGALPFPSYNGATLALIDQMRRHHPPTAAHSVRVARTLMAMWARAPEPLGDAETVLMAGALHDIGKLFVPAGTLGSGRKLDTEELAAIRLHPTTGAEVLASLGFPPVVVDAARAHHERWAGGGYPSGVRSEQLHPLTRAVAVADAFVAMVEPGRAYRRPMTKAAALAEIVACRGTHFDPTAADTLIGALKEQPGSPADADLPL